MNRSQLVCRRGSFAHHQMTWKQQLTVWPADPLLPCYCPPVTASANSDTRKILIEGPAACTILRRGHINALRGPARSRMTFPFPSPTTAEASVRLSPTVPTLPSTSLPSHLRGTCSLSLLALGFPIGAFRLEIKTNVLDLAVTPTPQGLQSMRGVAETSLENGRRIDTFY